jgi:transcriptional regulator of arginine metabolism
MKEHAKDFHRYAELRKLLELGSASTQEELCQELLAKGHSVTQSTISRWLRKLGVLRVVDDSGKTVYRLPQEPPLPRPAQASFAELVLSILHNSHMIVIRTVPGSASLIARHLDQVRPGEILGTLAGDDTVFVAPPASVPVAAVIAKIEASLANI